MARPKSPGRVKLESALVNQREAAGFSDNTLAKHYGVSFLTVERARRHLEAIGVIPAVAVRRCWDGYERNVARIGRRGLTRPVNPPG